MKSFSSYYKKKMSSSLKKRKINFNKISTKRPSSYVYKRSHLKKTLKNN